jgi:predicted MFS family arabinose efflux permease
VAGLLGGTVAARLPRKAVMITCDLTQAVVLVAIVLAPRHVQLQLLPVVAVAAGLLGTTSTVMLRSSVPDLVGQDDRMWANGLLVTGRAIAMAVGFAAGGILVSWLGYRAAFLVDAATFAVSAATLSCLALRFPPRSPAHPARTARLRPVFVALAATPAVLAIVVIRALDALGSASHNVGLPVYATQVQPASPASFIGNFLGVWAVGLIVAHQVVKRFYRGRDPGLAFVVSTAVMSAAFIAAFTGVPQPWVLPIALVAGMADGFTEITYTTRVQAEPDPARGHFFGLTAVAENAGLGVGMIMAAGLLEVWRPLWVAALMHGVVIVLALAYLAVAALRRTPIGEDRAREPV